MFVRLQGYSKDNLYGLPVFSEFYKMDSLDRPLYEKHLASILAFYEGEPMETEGLMEEEGLFVLERENLFFYLEVRPTAPLMETEHELFQEWEIRQHMTQITNWQTSYFRQAKTHRDIQTKNQRWTLIHKPSGQHFSFSLYLPPLEFVSKLSHWYENGELTVEKIKEITKHELLEHFFLRNFPKTEIK